MAWLASKWKNAQLSPAPQAATGCVYTALTEAPNPFVLFLQAARYAGEHRINVREFQ